MLEQEIEREVQVMIGRREQMVVYLAWCWDGYGDSGEVLIGVYSSREGAEGGIEDDKKGEFFPCEDRRQWHVSEHSVV